MDNLVIILAAGKGIRFDQDLPKQFYPLMGRTIIEHTIGVFDSHPEIHSIFVVIDPKFRDKIFQIIKNGSFQKVRKILNGGTTRQESSAIGVDAADNKISKILIHDGARPFVSPKIISQILRELDSYPAVNLGISPQDSIISIDGNNKLHKILDRKMIKLVQTPQGFLTPIIKKAHQLAKKTNKNQFTDDCSLVKEFKLGKIAVLEGDQENIKITTPFDLLIGQKIVEIK